MTRASIVRSPPLVPGWPSHRTPAFDDVDSVIKFVWRLHLDGDVTWRGAGRVHDALVTLREGLANSREAPQ